LPSGQQDLRLEETFGVMELMKRFSWLILLGVLAGCYSETSEPESFTLHGRYTLRTVDDQPLPAVMADQPNLRIEFLRGVVTLNPDLSFTDSTEVRRTESTLVRRVIDVAFGTYAQSGDVVNLNSTRGEHYSMTVRNVNQSLTQQLAGSVLIYRK
jgi:hypothetical protein